MQDARGSYIAQAAAGASATVSVTQVFQAAPAAAVDAVVLAEAEALFASMPVDMVPEPAGLPPGSRMPYLPNRLFVGRHAELAALAAMLKAGGTAALGRSAAPTGMGGVGKTQLACELAYRYGRFFKGGVFWLACGEPAAVAAEVASGGRGLSLHADFGGLPPNAQVDLVARELHSELPRLLVFDNCEDEAVLEAWTPRGGGCRVLVTSLREAWPRELGVRAVALGVLARDESVALLRKHRDELPATDRALDAIAHELGDLPLALHLAGAYLECYRHAELGRPTAYLAALRSPDLLSHHSFTGEGRSPTGHELHVARTFALSHDRLRPADVVDTAARAALMRAAWFAAGEPIPRDLLRLSAGVGAAEEAAQARFEDALRRLGALGLVTTQANGAIVLHRLVAAFVHSLAAGDNAAARVAVEEALSGEARRLNGLGDPRPIREWQLHLREVVAKSAAEADLDSGAAAQIRAGDLLDEFGWHLREIADLAGARDAFVRALGIHERIHGPYHPKVANALNNLGSVLRALGELTGALNAYTRALHIDEKAYGPNHPTVSMRINNVARVRKDLNDLPGALVEYERALEILVRSHGFAHESVAKVLNNIGRILHDRHKLDGARRKYEKAMEIFVRINGPDHPNIAVVLINLGNVLRELGDLAGARAAIERALEIDTQVYGPDHLEVATDLNSLGGILQDLGDVGGAQAAVQKALRIFEMLLGSCHQSAQIARNNLVELARHG